jgi:exopolysaccharide production protein ExoY
MSIGDADQSIRMAHNGSTTLFNGQALTGNLATSDQLLHVPWAYPLLKRGVDICGALLGLLVLALLLPLLAFCIWWEDRGPIFYKQWRVGRYGKPFCIYKLRSMIVHADCYLLSDPMLLAIWQERGKVQSDPRVTRVGRVLRRTGLDELPQMLNVLHGEMSLVGPRAVQLSEQTAFGELWELRLLVRPGLTGLWQISDRSTTTYLQRGLLDCTYIMECSLLADLYILYKTFPAIVCGSGSF